MQIRQSIPNSILTGHVQIGSRQIPRRAIFPIFLVLFALGGIFSPLFDLSHIHGLPTPRLFSEHLYFDSISDMGGFYAASFCKHWRHKVPIAVAIALVSTFLLVTLVG